MTGMGLVGAVVSAEESSSAQNPSPAPAQEPAGMPPAFGTAKPVGPEVSEETFVEAEKLVQVNLNKTDLAQVAKTWRVNLAPLYERRVGPRKMELQDGLAPWSRWDPVLAGTKAGRERNRVVRRTTDVVPLPSNETDIAFATVTQLSRWIESKKLTSERLTNIYLQRLEEFNPQLRCVITLTREHALAQAKKADAEIAAGKYRGPLHGIPWGGKDLLDTAGIATTYGAEPFRNRGPKEDAEIVAKL